MKEIWFQEKNLGILQNLGSLQNLYQNLSLSESLPVWDLQAVFNPYVSPFTLLSSTFSVLYSSHMNHGLPTTLFTSEISQLDHYLFCMFCWVATLSFWRTSLVFFHALFLILSQIKNALLQKCKYTISDNMPTLIRSYPISWESTKFWT